MCISFKMSEQHIIEAVTIIIVIIFIMVTIMLFFKIILSCTQITYSYLMN